MKSNKVLLGLFAGLMALTGGVANAQFYEVGPANIGGKVSSIVIDQQDASRTTIYAGAISGGLYVRTSDSDVLRNLYRNIDDQNYLNTLVRDTVSWHLVRFIDTTTGIEQTLPVSALVQGPDGTIFVGTGDNTYSLGSTYSKMSSKGRGIYRYKPTDGTFTLISYTDPTMNELFGAVRALDYYQHNDTLYFFAATNTGLYRWMVYTGGNDIDAAWMYSNVTTVMSGDVDQFIALRNLNMAYFVADDQLYKLGNLTSATLNPISLTSTNSAFENCKAIKLAVAPSDNRYLYAMVINSSELMENVYLTTNGQTWTALATSSVRPLTQNSGLTCGTITVDPTNPKRIILGGTNIWIGEGFVENSNFQWTKSSYSEFELNRGDYMSSVFNNAVFVHSGIQQMLPVGRNGEIIYYIATNGGVYCTSTDFNSYENINRGMNNVQITNVAVTPDGSIISGAANSACPFIEARMAHNGGNNILSWYDDGSMGNVNHDANILWTGDGGKVAASAFQQITPQVHRNIFVSSANGKLGRSFTDYMDYSNSQTWTTGVPFLTNTVVGGPTVGSISLWESNNDTYYKDSIKVGFDLNGYYFNSANDTLWIIKDKDNPSKLYSCKLVRTVIQDSLDTSRVRVRIDTVWVNRTGKLKLNAGEKGVFLSKNNSEYPFIHTFTASEVGSGNNQKTVADSFMVKNPIVSRMLAVVDIASASLPLGAVIYSWTANDFSKVYDPVTDNDQNLDDEVKTELQKKFMWWSPLLIIKRSSSNTNLYPRDAVMSQDGRHAYISTYNTANHRSQLYRINGFENLNFSKHPNDLVNDIDAENGFTRVLSNTKFLRNGTDEWFARPISSITVDPRPGKDRIVLTFEDYSDSYANVVIIDSASSSSWNAATNVRQLPITGHVGIPAYCAMIEDSTGNIYVGTSDGVFIYDDIAGTWSPYNHLQNLPVTSIVQQTKKLTVQRATKHTGITENNYLFAKTKWPRAIYFGTYGRGIFMDMTYVTDTINEVSDSADYTPVRIPHVANIGNNKVSVYPNPVMGEAHVAVTAAEAGNAVLRIYDLNGRMVTERRLGYANEGEQIYTIGTEGMAKGMYLINVTISGHTAATKMMVR